MQWNCDGVVTAPDTPPLRPLLRPCDDVFLSSEAPSSEGLSKLPATAERFAIAAAPSQGASATEQAPLRRRKSACDGAIFTMDGAGCVKSAPWSYVII